MYSSDWNDLITNISWLVGEGDIVEISSPRMAYEGLFQPTSEFLEIFPTLSQLLNLGRVTEIQINGRVYYIYGWTDMSDHSFGWQCLPGDPIGNYSDLHPHHALLLSCFGGIKERWHEPFTWLLNLNSALCAKDTRSGFNGWDNYYLKLCEAERIQPIVSPANYRAFALEANGNCTIYHSITGQVLMFAHDHCFDHIEPLAGCPDYTLYTVKNCPDFPTWVETVAQQWLQHVQKTHY